MIPSRALIVCSVALIALGMTAWFGAPWLGAWGVGAAILVLACSVDAARALRLPQPVVARLLPPALPVASWSLVRLDVSWAGPGQLAAELFDHHPAASEVDGLPMVIRLHPGSKTSLSYRLRPLSRGEAKFGTIEILMRSPWRFWQCRRFASGPASVRVLPDFRPLTRYALLAVDNRVSQIGVRLRPRRGQGIEIHGLREYRIGDSLRQIDWKATARRMTLISRDYQDERNQQVVFLLDCGRSMRSVDQGEPHFDHALRSILLLSYVALKQGDSVGLLTLGGRERWFPPVKGPGAMRALLDAVHDLDTCTEAPDYLGAAERFVGLQRRRALAIIISNLRDDEGGELAAAMQFMRHRHLVLLASLRETVLDDDLVRPIQSFEDARRRAAVHHYLISRRRAHAGLAGRGLRLCDVAPRELPVALVNRYLDIKRTGAL